VAIRRCYLPGLSRRCRLRRNDASLSARAACFGDALPSRSIGRTDIREDSVYRVTLRDPAVWRPEGETVVESILEMVLELDGPSRSAIDGFVDAKVPVLFRWTMIRDLIAYALHVAELQRLGSGTTPAFQVSPPSVVTT